MSCKTEAQERRRVLAQHAEIAFAHESALLRLALVDEVRHKILRNPGDGIDWAKLDRDEFETTPLAGCWPVLTLQCVKQRLPGLVLLRQQDIVSDRFRRLCDGFQVNAEFLPANIVRPNGAPASHLPYWFLHALERIDCIDFDASDYDIYGSLDKFVVARFRRLVMRPEVIGNRDFCSGLTTIPRCTSRRSCATPSWGPGSWSASGSWKEHKPNRHRKV